MFLTGIADEAGALIDTQIRATKQLGWDTIEARTVEVPGYEKANVHDIPEAALDIVAGELKTAGISIYCFGSTIGNWSKKIEDSFDVTLAEINRSIPRMQRLGTKYIRVMSYKPRDGEDQMESERFRRMREITRRFLDAGIQPVHENCMNYGGMGWPFALRLLENVPGLKWVFDTANPIFNDDRSKARPWPKQDPWEFYTRVKPWIVHVHIKDARWNPAKNDADYKFPGEGDGAVRPIIKDLLASGYDGGFSIEPHLAVVFHDASVTASAEAQFNTYVEYGRRLQKLVDSIQAELATKQASSPASLVR
ncbi:MAG: sugar phosphate isomerase/epimerase [Verrucomicrobia subdivision 3 bacterium]|nr:sugar phosphate isomerase/epimerase [Limisphaerales bacterium]